MILRSIFLIFVSLVVLKTVSCEIYRLPQNVKPIRYFLTLEPKLKVTDGYAELPYYGSVTMELEILENTRNITFHKKRLEIDESSVRVLDKHGKVLKITAQSANPVEEMYTVQTEEELVKSATYTLEINNFHNNLTYDGLGFFKAYYSVRNKETGEDETRVVAATHFQPAGARIAFPCFDEPALKATFIVSLIRKEGFNSVSNEALESTKDLGDGRFKDTFKETPIMSTYTLAFAVSDYGSKSLGRFRILTKASAIKNNETDFALDTSVKTLKALEEYTGIDFVIDKMDQFSVPDSYFRYHAMENWGLVIYGESHLLRSEAYDSADDYQRTTVYISHEFAHQWFGNLVTPAWWDYIWIGESFAAYFQYHTAAIVQPTWKLREQFVIDVVQESFRKEEHGAHPLNYRIRYSGQYPPFHIMYEKGSTIIRMMEHFLSPEIFRKGLNIYLNNNKFKATFPSHLYEALQEAVDKANANHLLNNMTVNEIMKTWDSTKGFPIVTITRNYETGSVTVTQKSLFDSSTKWMIPINFVFSSDKAIDFSKTTADLWLTERSTVVNHNFSTDGWLLVNKQQTGYYRVNYDRENWERIVDFITTDKFKSIHLLNRAQLLDDAFYFARKGDLSWDIALRLGEYIKRERDYIALAAFSNAIENHFIMYGEWYYRRQKARDSIVFHNYTLINTIIDEDTTEYDMHKAYIRNTLGDVIKELGPSIKETDTHLDKITRSKLLNYYYAYLSE